MTHASTVKYANCESVWTTQLVTPHRKSLLLFLHRKSQYSAIERTISPFAWNRLLRRYDLMDLGS